MNEPNVPKNSAHRPNSAPTPPNAANSGDAQPFNPPRSSEEAIAPANAQTQPFPNQAVPGWQTVEFPNAISADASQQQALYSQNQSQKKRRSPSSGTTFNSPPSPEVLIALFQDANQRNHELASRIAELEEALEQSRQALQAEVDRVSDVDERQLNAGTDEELAAARQQISYLLNQLEFAHQTTQRQEILVETLTGQLQASQERVMQLEQESTALKQHSEAQLNHLRQCESHCQDLQARLQRQQRYTLQFKSALEKCLEVPPPSYETAAVKTEVDAALKLDVVEEPTSPAPSVAFAEPQDVAVAAEAPSSPNPVQSAQPPADVPLPLSAPFFPKAREIQPWAAAADATGTVANEAGLSAHAADGGAVLPSPAGSTGAPGAQPAADSKFLATLVDLVGADLTTPALGDPAASDLEDAPDTDSVMVADAAPAATSDTSSNLASESIETIQDIAPSPAPEAAAQAEPPVLPDQPSRHPERPRSSPISFLLHRKSRRAEVEAESEAPNPAASNPEQPPTPSGAADTGTGERNAPSAIPPLQVFNSNLLDAEGRELPLSSVVPGLWSTEQSAGEELWQNLIRLVDGSTTEELAEHGETGPVSFPAKADSPSPTAGGFWRQPTAASEPSSNPAPAQTEQSRSAEADRAIAPDSPFPHSPLKNSTPAAPEQSRSIPPLSLPKDQAIPFRLSVVAANASSGPDSDELGDPWLEPNEPSPAAEKPQSNSIDLPHPPTSSAPAPMVQPQPSSPPERLDGLGLPNNPNNPVQGEPPARLRLVHESAAAAPRANQSLADVTVGDRPAAKSGANSGANAGASASDPEATPDAEALSQTAPAGPAPNWPSPLLNPSQPAKKRETEGVDLPAFLR